MKYQEPGMEIVIFEAEDIVTASSITGEESGTGGMIDTSTDGGWGT